MLNVDGMGGRSGPNAELKARDLCHIVEQHDIAVLVETRSNDASRLLQFLPGYSVHKTEVASEQEGKKGFGIAVFVSPVCSDHVRILKVSEHLQCIWLACDKTMFGLAEDVVLGAAYVNPHSSSFSARALCSHFTDLYEDVLYALQVSRHVLLCGDFNAHVGALSEVSDGHVNLLRDFPEFVDDRRAVCGSVNKAGELLCDVAAASELVLATGRIEGDNGQPSFTGYYKDKQSRPDHVLMSSEVYGLAKRFEMIENFVSDHSGLSVFFKVKSKVGEAASASSCAHVCRREMCANKLVLRWKPERAFVFAQHIIHNDALMTQFEEAERDKAVDKLAFCVRSLIFQAASSREVGMSAFPKCPFARERKRKGPLNPIWFDEECAEKRFAFREAVQRGEAKHACRFLKKESARTNRRKKRWHTRQLRSLFLDRLFRKDPEVHALLRKEKKSFTSPVPAPVWHDHLQMHFRTERQTTEVHRVAPEDMAVPVGRGHPPPEVLLRRGEESGWAPEPDEFYVPDLDFLVGLVGKHFQKLSVGASPGFDAIPIAFLKHACMPVQNGSKAELVNVLVPLLARLFKVVLSEARVPRCWKVAKLSPLHKKGAVLDPGNYRMLAVSGVMYRIYANVLKDLVTDWCVKKRKVPDTQFGFFPGRSTLHPLFILRHLKHAAKKFKPKGSPQLHVAFIDFSQAYDTVPRSQLWRHLQQNAMPSPLLSAIRDMYEGDKYILIDGEKRAEVQPINGVKQGCPLSPLLFSLYINDVYRDVGRGVEGAVMGDKVNHVAVMLYADDLALMANSPEEMRVMLENLKRYAARKGLTVNTAKSEVVHFNHKSGSAAPSFSYNDVMLPQKDQFKYLGMLCDKRLNLKVAEEFAVRPYMVAQRRIQDFVKEHGLRDKPHALLWLSKVYGAPAGMYACQVWGTEYLSEGKEFQSVLQKRHLCSLRRILGVKKTTANWSVLRECGQDPLQFGWFRAVVKLYNSMLESNSETLRKALKADIYLSSADSSCWSAQVAHAFSGLRGAEVFKQNLSRAAKISMQAFVSDLRFRQQAVWREAAGLSPREVNKKVVTYQSWCGCPLLAARRSSVPLPLYLFKDLDQRVMRNVSRFRLRAHHFRVESCKWLGGSNICDRCECTEVQDEKHVLFFCRCAEVCALRAKYKDLFVDIFRPLHAFAPASESEFIPFLACHHDITDAEVNAFVNQNSIRLSRLLSDLVSLFDIG